MIKLFVRTKDPKCKILYDFLNKYRIKYYCVNIDSIEAQSELQYDGLFTIRVPVIQTFKKDKTNIAPEYLTMSEIFSEDKLTIEAQNLLLTDSEKNF